MAEHSHPFNPQFAFCNLQSLFWLSFALQDVPEGDSWLSPAELFTLAGFKFPKRRSDWLLGRWTGKQALSRYLGLAGGLDALSRLEIRAAPDGAPEAFVAGRPAGVAFSISHSAGVSLCVVGDAASAAGCDLEKIEPREASLAEDYFTVAEAALVAGATEEDRATVFTLIWCAKESALKSLRLGLRRDTRSVAVSLSETRDRESWNSLSVDCLESGLTFHGWWRVREGFVQAVTSALPSPPPIELSVSGT